jgi:hypothetical protein
MRIRFAQPSVTPSVERKDCRIRVIHSDERDNGRGERIRTSDPLVPNQVLYQAEPLPEPSFAARKRIGNMRRATGQIDRAANRLECSRGSRIAVSLCGSPIKPPRIC